jgi:hypothetical protein
MKQLDAITHVHRAMAIKDLIKQLKLKHMVKLCYALIITPRFNEQAYTKYKQLLSVEVLN